MKHMFSLINSHRSRGFTLLEVLITVVILSIGLLGIAGLQLSGMKNNNIAYARSQATVLAYDIIDRMRANRIEVLDGKYNVDIGQAIASSVICEDVASNCNPAAMARYDLYEWKQALQNTLPAGDGSIVANGTITVSIQWLEVSGNGTPTTFSVEAAL